MHRESGVTLVELLVVIVVSSLIVGSILSLFVTNHRIYLQQEEVVVMQQELRCVLEQVAGEIRMAGYNPGRVEANVCGFRHCPGIGTPDYGRATNSSAIYFTMDLNGDGVIAENGTGSAAEHGGFRLNVKNDGSIMPAPDNVLRRYDTGAVKWQPMATNIQNISFRYFDVTGNETASLDDISSVEVTAVAAASDRRAHLALSTRTMSTRVYCRNHEMQ